MTVIKTCIEKFISAMMLFILMYRFLVCVYSYYCFCVFVCVNFGRVFDVSTCLSLVFAYFMTKPFRASDWLNLNVIAIGVVALCVVCSQYLIGIE